VWVVRRRQVIYAWMMISRIPAVVCTTLILFAFLISGPYIIALVGGVRAAH
jgi:hypothetical protein